MFVSETKQKINMNTEIYQLVKHLDRTGLENLSYEEKRVELWQRAMKEWNKTHSPVTTSLEDVYQAFKFRWPQIYGGEPYNNELYMSFSYIDYLFSMNTKNQVCGGIWKRDGERFNEPINMAAEQITDLAALLRIVPEPLEDWEKDEDTIKEEQDWICHFDPSDWHGESRSQFYLHLQNLAVSQYMLGLFEDTILSISRAIQYWDYCSSTPSRFLKSITPEENFRIFCENMIILGEMNTLLANAYSYLFYYYEADCRYKMAKGDLFAIEQDDYFNDYVCKSFSQSKETNPDLIGKRCIFLNWAWDYAMFNVKCHRTKKAIEILCKAKKVANSMNKAEKGKWSAKLESITNKIKELKES